MTERISAGERKAAQVINLGVAFTHVPVPDLPLKDVAYDKYAEYARLLLDRGKLNTHTKALCEQIGVLHAQNHRKLALGQTVGAASFDKIDRYLRELRLIDESDAAAPESEGQENRFARFGIIVRRGAKKAEVRPS